MSKSHDELIKQYTDLFSDNNKNTTKKVDTIFKAIGVLADSSISVEAIFGTKLTVDPALVDEAITILATASEQGITITLRDNTLAVSIPLLSDNYVNTISDNQKVLIMNTHKLSAYIHAVELKSKSEKITRHWMSWIFNK